MLSLERECKFSKIDVFITSPIFISRSLEKEVKNQAFWDEAGSKIRSDLGRVWMVFWAT